MNLQNDVSVWIPAQTTSQRLPEKNVRPFSNGKSLLEIKIEQLAKCIPASKITVSTDSERLIDKLGELGVKGIQRPQTLLGNKIFQSDLIDHFFAFYDGAESDQILWCQVTDPLFDDFSGFLQQPLPKNTARILATAFKKHAFHRNEPVNFQFGHWHKVTQDLEPIIFPRWSCFLHRACDFRKIKYHFGLENEFYITDAPFIDIDTESDFILAARTFEMMQKSGFPED